jgi:DNA-binding LacI/PurR family transcriptional regulator
MNGSFADNPEQETGSNSTPEALPRKLADLQKTITMAQIAKAAGVSQGAISSLLNDRDYGIRVSDKTRERVFRVCREMGYIPNDLRAVVRMYPEVGDFCILVADHEFAGGIGNSGMTRVLQTAIQEATPYSVTVCPYSQHTEYNDLSVLPPAVTAGVASKFIFAGPANPSLAKAIIQKDLPVCWLGADLPMEGVQCFLAESNAAHRQALQELRNLGHHQVLLFSDPANTPASCFLNGNSKIFSESEARRLDLGFADILSCNATIEAGIHAYDTFLKSPSQPTAAVFSSDLAASGFSIAARLRTAGSSVPVISTDGQSSDATRTQGVSYLRAPVEKMVSDAIRWISKAVKSGALNESGKQVYPHVWEPAPEFTGLA